MKSDDEKAPVDDMAVNMEADADEANAKDAPALMQRLDAIAAIQAKAKLSRQADMLTPKRKADLLDEVRALDGGEDYVADMEDFFKTL